VIALLLACARPDPATRPPPAAPIEEPLPDVRSVTWVRRCAVTGYDGWCDLTDLVPGPDGGVIVAGDHYHEVSFGAEQPDAVLLPEEGGTFVATLTADGTISRVVRVTRRGGRILSLSAGPDGDVTLTGAGDSGTDLSGAPMPTGWIDRLSPVTGRVRWRLGLEDGSFTRAVSTPTATITAVDAKGPCDIGGVTVPLSDDGYDGVLVALDAETGHLRWAWDHPAYVQSLAVTPDGGVRVLLGGTGELDLGGGVVSRGTTLVALDPDGHLEWFVDRQPGEALAVGGDRVFLAGARATPAYAWETRAFDAHGVEVWPGPLVAGDLVDLAAVGSERLLWTTDGWAGLLGADGFELESSSTGFLVGSNLDGTGRDVVAVEGRPAAGSFETTDGAWYAAGIHERWLGLDRLSPDPWLEEVGADGGWIARFGP
jgi:outer membrane protein assembly factor BamB